MADTSNMITISCADHHNRLICQLWNYFQRNRAVDIDVQWGGQSIRAHRLIMELFLSPEKLQGQCAPINTEQKNSDNILYSLFEFLYNGKVTIRKENLNSLLNVAIESDFHMLVQAVTQAAGDDETTYHDDVTADSVAVTCEPDIDPVADPSPRSLKYDKAVQTEPNRKSNESKRKKTMARRRRSVVALSSAVRKKSKGRLAATRKLSSNLKSCQVSLRRLPNSIIETKGNLSMINSEFDRKPFKCLIGQCDAAYAQSEALSRHTKTAHPGVRCQPRVRINEEPDSPITDDDSDYQPQSPRRDDDISNQSYSFAIDDNDNDDSRSQSPAAIDIDGEQLKCSICGYRAKTKLGLKCHQKCHNRNKSHKCPIENCQAVFSQSNSLPKHLKLIHGDERPYRCNVDSCQTNFASSSERRRHMREQHSDRTTTPHLCTICGKQYKAAKCLKVHFLSHTAQKSYKCQVCEKAFATHHALNLHTPTHSDVKPYRCHLCDRQFSVKASLVNHVRIHTGETPFNCSQCDKSFTSSFRLRDHILKIHTAENIFICDVCGKKMRQSELAEHSKRHLGIRDFPCNSCPKKFFRQSALKSHVRNVHSATKRYVCEICAKVCASIYSLRQHQCLHRDEALEYQCPFCPKRFLNDQRLQVHRMTHTNEKPYECNLCPKKFAQRGNLYQHQFTHSNEKRFKCEICSKEFKQKCTLRDHQVSHTGVLAHKCQYCGKQFGLRQTLKLHERLHNGIRPFKCDHCPEAFIYHRSLNVHLRSHGILTP